MALRDRLDAYEKLVRLDKPIGILLLLWPTLWALWLARGAMPNLLLLWIFILGTVLMRSAGCAVNDFADRGFDAEVARTRERPLARGRGPSPVARPTQRAGSRLSFGAMKIRAAHRFTLCWYVTCI